MPDSKKKFTNFWICEYDEELGETDVTCSFCRTTRTHNGCHISVDDEPLFDDFKYCPDCGKLMLTFI